MVHPLWRTVWRVLKKLKLELAYDPAIPLLGIYPGKNHNSKRHVYPDVHCSTIYNSQDMEATKMSINRGMDKEDAVHRYNGILLSHKKNLGNLQRTWIDLETVIHSEVS